MSPTRSSRTERTPACHAAWPRIKRSMCRDTSGASRGYGVRCRSRDFGSCAVRARAARGSMIKLIHSICIAVSGLSESIVAPATARKQADKLTVN